YIGSTSGHLYALDGTTGRLLWSDNVGSAMWVAPGYGVGAPWQGFAAAQGYFFAAAGNQLVAYRGSQVGPSPSPSPSPSPTPTPTPTPTPNPLRTVPTSSPNASRGPGAIPPVAPSCCGT